MAPNKVLIYDPCPLGLPEILTVVRPEYSGQHQDKWVARMQASRISYLEAQCPATGQ